jgi:hypothetical protein
MIRAWLKLAGGDVGASGAHFELKPGLTMLGGVRGDIPVPGSGGDCVHVWSDPPKLIFVGAGDPPRVNGHVAMEESLHDGDRIEWRGLVATFGCEGGPPRLQELPADWHSPEVVANPPVPAGPRTSESADAAEWRWLKAGMAAELALADREVIKRWQGAAARGEFNAEAASKELLASAPELDERDPRLTQRCSRLMRELLLSSVSKRPTRLESAKQGRGGCGFFLGQLIVLSLVALIVIAGMLVARTRFGQSIDAILDRLVDEIFRIKEMF